MNKNTEEKVVCCLVDLYEAFTDPTKMESAKQKYKDNNVISEILTLSEQERLKKLRKFKNS